MLRAPRMGKVNEFEMSPPPMLGSPGPDEYGRYLARVISVCPGECGKESQFVIGIETPDKCIRYLIDHRSAILLAYGLGNHMEPFHLSGSDGTPNADT